MGKGADARMASGGESYDLRMDVRLIAPPGGYVKIGRDVANREPHGAKPIPQVRVGHPVADEGERNGGGVTGLLRLSCERRQEAINIHVRKSLTEEVITALNGSGDLEGRCLSDISVVVHSSSPMSFPQRTSPSEGSMARCRPFRRSANATALLLRSPSSNPK